jgi:hypothetical protein
MGKKIQFPAIALGSEPKMPGIEEITEFITGRLGKETDLVSYHLNRSLQAQKKAGITSPCGGGVYYAQRIVDLLGSEISDPDLHSIIQDAEEMHALSRVSSMAIPAPHRVTPDPHDDVLLVYKKILRAMRDHHLSRQIIHASSAIESELETLSSGKVLFFMNSRRVEDTELLLESQRDLIFTADLIGQVGDLSERYDIRRYILLDPASDLLHQLLSVTDPDHIQVAGYAQGAEEEYWMKIQNAAALDV